MIRNIRRLAAKIPAGIERKEAPAALELQIKGIKDEILAKIAAGDTALTSLQRQVDALDASMQHRHTPGADQTKSIAKELFESPEFKHLGEMGGRGRVALRIEDFQKKALTSVSMGSSVSGVLQIDREPGIVSIQYRQLRIRDLLRSKPTTLPACDYVKVSSFTNAASPQVEASDKAQSDMSLTTVSSRVRTIAHWIPVTKQVFEDLDGLEEAINGHLMYGLKLKEEIELLSGDNTGEHLNGLITQATAFDTSLLVAAAGWNRLDVIARAIQQAERTDYMVDVIVLHTDDFWAMALTKDMQGRYLFGDPGANTVPRLWGRPVAVTNSIASGSFLVGSAATALIRDRADALIEISDSHADYFIKNMLAVRAEERLTLQVMRPAAWISGSFTTSPASA